MKEHEAKKIADVKAAADTAEAKRIADAKAVKDVEAQKRAGEHGWGEAKKRPMSKGKGQLVPEVHRCLFREAGTDFS